MTTHQTQQPGQPDKNPSIRYYLSERFRLRFEESGIDDLLDQNVDSLLPPTTDADTHIPEDEAIDLAEKSQSQIPSATASRDREGDSDSPQQIPTADAVVRTLDGEIAGDECATDAMDYQILLGKIEELLERLRLEA